jgi:hypothetical protein
MLNSAYLAGASGHGRYFALDITVHEQTQLNRACNIFNIAVFGLSLGIFIFFIL